MMTAESQGDTELTSQQKYHRLRPKAIVEVRLLSHAGADEKWFRAKIKDTNKEGAYCQIIDGPHTRFWHWREIRPCAATTGLGAISVTLGEVAQTHLKPVAELPRREPMPAPPALHAALVPVAPPSPPASLVRLTRPEQPEQQQQAQPPELTAGEMVRQARLAAGLTQEQAASKLSKLMNDPAFTNKRLSSLETGFRAPTETEQIALIEGLGIDLAQLLAACERDATRRDREARNKRSRESAQRRREEKAQLAGREIAHRSSVYRPREVAPIVPPPTRESRRAPAAWRRASPSAQTLEDLIDALIAIVPMPLDAAERKDWFRCARELFALSRES